MTLQKLLLSLLICSFLVPIMAQDEEECDSEADDRTFTASFSNSDCHFRNRYFTFQEVNPYWLMEPGWQVVLEGEDDDEFITLQITVLNETEWVAGVKTRIIEEREWIDGEIYEVSRNYFAVCPTTNDIYYFGEAVDFYEDGEVIDHRGAWRADDENAEPGILIPGRVLIGARFHQEVVPDVAMDRAEIMDIADVEIDGVLYEDVLMMKETSPLDDPCDYSIKWYAPGIGMVRDDEMYIVEYGYSFQVPPHYPFKD